MIQPSKTQTPKDSPGSLPSSSPCFTAWTFIHQQARSAPLSWPQAAAPLLPKLQVRLNQDVCGALWSGPTQGSTVPLEDTLQAECPGLQDYLLSDAQLCPPPERAQSSRQSRATQQCPQQQLSLASQQGPDVNSSTKYDEAKTNPWARHASAWLEGEAHGCFTAFPLCHLLLTKSHSTLNCTLHLRKLPRGRMWQFREGKNSDSFKISFNS